MGGINTSWLSVHCLLSLSCPVVVAARAAVFVSALVSSLLFLILILTHVSATGVVLVVT